MMLWGIIVISFTQIIIVVDSLFRIRKQRLINANADERFRILEETVGKPEGSEGETR